MGAASRVSALPQLFGENDELNRLQAAWADALDPLLSSPLVSVLASLPPAAVAYAAANPSAAPLFKASVTVAATTFIPATTALVPALVTSPGSVGQMCADLNYLYICCAPSKWRRVALAAF